MGQGRGGGIPAIPLKEGGFFVFGGYGKDNCQTNQVHVFDTAMQTWSQPEIKGTPPTPRDSHSCTAIGDNLYVFGGTDGMNPLKDLHILDTSSHTWISPTVRGEGPDAREGHSAALVGKRLFIFGGCGKSSNNNDEVYFNDLYILNTETLVWKELHTTGQKLTPRAGHSTVAFGKNLFVFGGFTDAQNLYDDLYMLDVDTGVWTKVMTTGIGPSARFSVAGDCLDPQMGGVLVFIGGCNRSLEALDDMFLLVHRKRAGGEIGTGMLNGDHNNKAKVSRILKQDTVDHIQPENAHGKETASHEPKTEAAVAPGLKNLASSDVSQLHEVTVWSAANPEPSVAPLNLNDDMITDAPNSDTEFPNTAKDSVSITLSLNQGDDESPDEVGWYTCSGTFK
ncbi:hypothetical protein GH714_043296 [Hevea brasiliensis]|uniref:Uncharacterized protein n=1 Tax=Hevea brasiliensis TaxID=3981 RepID=A0A6A6K2V3_HEVBR|nr:hypothetical protein GH714_043296 [Hevea brasiliensis]